MVHRLVRRGLLRVIAGKKSQRTRKRHAPRLPWRILAASDQSVTRCTPQQPAAGVSIYRLRSQDSGGELRVSDVAAAGANGCAVTDANAYRVEVPVIRVGCVITEGVLAAKFVRDRIQNLLDLGAPADETFGEKKRTAAAVIGEGVQHIHVYFVVLFRGSFFAGEQSGQRQSPWTPIGLFVCISQRRDADRVNQDIGTTYTLQYFFEPCNARGVFAIRN